MESTISCGVVPVVNLGARGSTLSAASPEGERSEASTCSCSNSVGGRSPSDSCRRALLNQVLDDRELELRGRLPDAVLDQLDLERVDERLGQRVVVGIADRADRLQHLVIGQGLAVVDRGVLGGLNRSSQQCVREMNLRIAGDGCAVFTAGTHSIG